ncbi:hypothetical protein BDR26DRAFT_922062 [Obelidium mucronatum]|nr:hypothetical protein BDR26DRAFT_922062 [Obelidium mucronatum]
MMRQALVRRTPTLSTTVQQHLHKSNTNLFSIRPLNTSSETHSTTSRLQQPQTKQHFVPLSQPQYNNNTATTSPTFSSRSDLKTALDREIPQLRKDLRSEYRSCFDVSYLSRKQQDPPKTLFQWIASIKSDFTDIQEGGQPQELKLHNETKLQQESVMESKLATWQKRGAKLATGRIQRINELIYLYNLETASGVSGMEMLELEQEMDRAVFEQLFEVE